MTGRSSRLRHKAPPRGLTLVELMVGVAVFVVVIGLALGMMIETERAARKMNDHEAAVQYCQRVIERVAASVAAAVAPTNLSGLTQRAPITPRFEANRLTLVTYGQQPGGAASGVYLNQVTVSMDDPSEGGRPGIRQTTEPVAETSGSQVTKASVEILGGGLPEAYQPVIAFAYGGAGKPGAGPSYQASWSTDEWPDLVRITVRAEPNDGLQRRAVALTTATIPGLVGQATPKPGAAGETAGGAAEPPTGGAESPSASQEKPDPEAQP